MIKFSFPLSFSDCFGLFFVFCGSISKFHFTHFIETFSYRGCLNISFVFLCYKVFPLRDSLNFSKSYCFCYLRSFPKCALFYLLIKEKSWLTCRWTKVVELFYSQFVLWLCYENKNQFMENMSWAWGTFNDAWWSEVNLFLVLGFQFLFLYLFFVIYQYS